MVQIFGISYTAALEIYYPPGLSKDHGWTNTHPLILISIKVFDP